MIRTEGLTKSFSGFHAIDGVDFAVEESELRSIIGPNGAGKTTFFNLISGALEPTEGTIHFRGDNVTGAPPYELAEKGIARSFQVSNLFDGMTVLENIQLGLIATKRDSLSLGYVFSDVRRDKELEANAYAIAEEVELVAEAEKTVDELAHGKKRKLEIAIALSVDPALLLLDEPAAGLTTEETSELIDTIEGIATDHTIILVEHDVDLVLGISDTISVLHDGQILAEGPPGEIREDVRVQEVYLGGH